MKSDLKELLARHAKAQRPEQPDYAAQKSSTQNEKAASQPRKLTHGLRCRRCATTFLRHQVLMRGVRHGIGYSLVILLYIMSF